MIKVIFNAARGEKKKNKGGIVTKTVFSD